MELLSQWVTNPATRVPAPLYHSRVETLPARLSTFDQPSEDVKDLHEVLPLLGSELKKDYGEKVCESEGGISEFSVMEKRVEVETVVPKDAQSEIRGLNSEEKENDDVCSKESLMKDLKTTLISYATELVNDGYMCMALGRVKGSCVEGLASYSMGLALSKTTASPHVSTKAFKMGNIRENRQISMEKSFQRFAQFMR
ncbi:type II myosin heavy chain [Striga asiatica]|uniref:Type II myosin heavy chain n=1 Tax=Striga asiatica TaxID=4170 RepID=A0A5A7RHJ7_STRAF|nr:type II myosin heavy chain [Striga asiatica]